MRAEGIIANDAPDEEVIEACEKAGRELAELT